MLNAFHMRNLRRLLGIIRQDWVTNASILVTDRHASDVCHPHPETPALTCAQDGIWSHPKDILYEELASGTRPSGRPTLRYKDTCKRSLKPCGINPVDLEAVTSDRTSWWPMIKNGVISAEERREPVGGSSGGLSLVPPHLPSQPLITSAASVNAAVDLAYACTATVDATVQLTRYRKPLSLETEGCHHRHQYK